MGLATVRVAYLHFLVPKHLQRTVSMQMVISYVNHFRVKVSYGLG